MSEITEKKSFRVLPCKLDKDLFKEIGNTLENQSSKIYEAILEKKLEELKTETKTSMSQSELKQLAEGYILLRKEAYMPYYILTSPSKDIESYEIKHFVDAKWPSDTENISVEMGEPGSPLRVNIDIHLERPKMDKSRISVSGQDATLVHGLSDQLANLFEGKKLGYYLVVEYWPIRVLLSILIIGFILLSAGLVLPQVWQANSLILVAFFGLGVFVLEEPLKWLFPRFEFGENPLPKRFRKWILMLISGSGLISAIILKLLGLD